MEINNAKKKRDDLREHPIIHLISRFRLGVHVPFLWPKMSEELHLTNANLGMASSVLAIAWAIAGAVLGYLADKWHKRRIFLVIAIVVFSVCSALSGAVTFFFSLMLFRLVMGIAEGPILPISQSLIVDVSQAKRRGFNMGVINGAGPGLIGGILGPPIMIWSAAHFGWRGAFYLTIIPGIILAVILVFLLRKHPQRLQEKPINAQPVRKEKISYLQILRVKNIWLCMLISCFFVTWFMSILSFTPTFLVQVRQMDEKHMGLVMSAIGLAWVVWSLIIPSLSDLFGRKIVLIAFSIVAIFCPYMIVNVSGYWALPIAVFCTYTGLGCFTLFMATIPSESIDAARIATALGLIMGIGEVVGGGIVPFVAGFLADKYGLTIVMWIATGGAIVATLLSLFLDETAPVKVAKKAASANLS